MIRRSLPLVTSCVLGLALSLKLHEGLTAVVLSLDRPWFTLLVISEAILLAWLISGRWTRVLRFTLAAVFASFTIVTIGLALHGAASCGCFGIVHVPPWVTACLDASLCVAWLRHPPTPPHPHRIRLVGAASVLVTITALATWIAVRPVHLPPPPAAIATAPAPAQLQEGRWLVLAYRDDCPHCQADFATWADALRRSRHAGNRIACVEIGPTLAPDGLYREARLTAELAPLLHWPDLPVADTPAAVRLDDGRIVATYRLPWELETR